MSRQLAIRTGVVNRIAKELVSYTNESEMLKQRVEKMEAAQEDEYEVRQQKRVYADSLQMIPDSEKRLEKAILDLQELLATHEDELAGSVEVTNAKAALEKAQQS